MHGELVVPLVAERLKQEHVLTLLLPFVGQVVRALPLKLVTLRLVPIHLFGGIVLETVLERQLSHAQQENLCIEWF